MDKKGRSLSNRLGPILALAVICWVVFVANNFIWRGNLTGHGIIPRQVSSLVGILWSPFLHVNLKHLVANTVPLLILGSILCFRGKGEFVLVTGAGIVGGGALTWLAGRHAVHVGASGLIFCYFGYLASLALFQRKLATLCLSAVCILGYGGVLRGILPTSEGVSWESHLSGLITGIAMAWLIARVEKEPL